jgi:hypothetical protein
MNNKYTYSDIIKKIPNKYLLSLKITKGISNIVNEFTKNTDDKVKGDTSTTKLFDKVACDILSK